MLKSLSIRNVVLIDSLDIDFSKGLIVLSGETGAGKSILLDSLGLLSGQRADTAMIRHGKDKLVVTGVFEVAPDNPIHDLAQSYDLDIDGDIIIKRSLTTDGKNKILFNDQIITLKLLKELAQNLVEIHGQHDNQGLLNSATHQGILDDFADCNKELDMTQKCFIAYKAAQKEYIEKENKLKTAKEEEENIRHWVQELQKANIEKGEEEKLQIRRHELMNAEKIIEKLNTAYSNLNGGNSIIDNVIKARNAISRANEIVNNKYEEIEQNLESAIYALNDSVEQIEMASNDISLNQNEVDNIETRLFMLRDLAKKHQTSVDSLPEKLQELSDSLKALDAGEENLSEIHSKMIELYNKYKEAAENLSKIRQKAAKKLDKGVMAELPPLKMEKARFQTIVTEKPEEFWSGKGWNNVCFEVSTNPNTPFGPLNKIASGGELSRFMLALKVNLAVKSQEETLIFDEIDSGIGGATAEAVGERLSRLSKKEQVFVVTHSPQVASFSDEHFKVEKHTTNDTTTTTLTKLDAKGKAEEIARMMAGEVITNEARAAARVLLNKKTQ